VGSFVGAGATKISRCDQSRQVRAQFGYEDVAATMVSAVVYSVGAREIRRLGDAGDQDISFTVQNKVNPGLGALSPTAAKIGRSHKGGQSGIELGNEDIVIAAQGRVIDAVN
jgi:hypothetical protein